MKMQKSMMMKYWTMTDLLHPIRWKGITLESGRKLRPMTPSRKRSSERSSCVLAWTFAPVGQFLGPSVGLALGYAVVWDAWSANRDAAGADPEEASWTGVGIGISLVAVLPAYVLGALALVDALGV